MIENGQPWYFEVWPGVQKSVVHLQCGKFSVTKSDLLHNNLRKKYIDTLYILAYAYKIKSFSKKYG
jgi:hypothetical protein